MACITRRCFHLTRARSAITNLQMPAMSPTMTEGGIAKWMKKEGEAFVAGDVLLEIDTDKATIDVEASDDGIMGKILVPDGSKSVSVGKIIALLAQEGDDISNLEIPKEAPPPPPSPPPSQPSPSLPAQSTSIPYEHSTTHPRPLFPSVHRLLSHYGIRNPEIITGTGVRGMLTRGDVLAYLGKASGPTGTFKVVPIQRAPIKVRVATDSLGSDSLAQPQTVTQPPTQTSLPQPPPALDGPAIRTLILSSFLRSSALTAPKLSPDHLTFDSLIADYLPRDAKMGPIAPLPSALPMATKSSTDKYFDGLI